MEDDLLIDRRGRVFRVSYPDKEAQLVSMLAGKAGPLDITHLYTESEVDALLLNAKCDDRDALDRVVSSIRLCRDESW
jgi:hypothetical protein